MRRATFTSALLLATFASLAPAQQAPQPQKPPPPPKTTDLRTVLLEQLHSTHDKSEWFVSFDTAVAGLTADQARWVPQPSGSAPAGAQMHSVAQLVAHLIYWNERSLAALKKEKPAQYSGNNEDTFVGYDVNQINAAQWTALIARFDRCMADLEKWTFTASDADLNLYAHASGLAHIGAHNAYHIGEIVYVRKLQGSWNPATGVK